MAKLQADKISDKITIPCDFVIEKKNEDQTETFNFNGSQEVSEECRVIDIGDKAIEEISCIKNGHLFVLGQTAIHINTEKLSCSLSKLLKSFYKHQ